MRAEAAYDIEQLALEHETDGSGIGVLDRARPGRCREWLTDRALYRPLLALIIHGTSGWLVSMDGLGCGVALAG